MDKEKIRKQILTILESMLSVAEQMNKKPDERLAALMRLNQELVDKEARLFNHNKDKEWDFPEAKLVDYARNSILNSCKTDHELSPKEFLDKARAFVHDLRALIQMKRVFVLLIDAYQMALKGSSLEAEALSLDKEDFEFKDKVEQAGKLFADTLNITNQANVISGDVHGLSAKDTYFKLDLLRNQIITLCMDIFNEEPANRRFVLPAKANAKIKASELISELHDALGLPL